MLLKKLKLNNFRTYESLELQFSNKITIFTGQNGVGKTNILEAICLSSIGRSFRTPRDKELIKWGSEYGLVKVEAEKKGYNSTDTVKIKLSLLENKRTTINNLPITRLGELMGVISTVFFSPTELKIVQGSPSERRAFLDIALCQISKVYFYLLQRYQKILSQRNKLLKSKDFTPDTLEIWNRQLIEAGSKIIKTRKGFIERLKEKAKQNHSFLALESSQLNIKYDGVLGEELSEIEEGFIKKQKQDLERDTRLGFTHTGPHRDDIIFLLGNMDVRGYASQGQQRTVALSLKLAEIDIATETSGQSPILLLDDVLSELDISRQQKLLEKIKNTQTLITATHIEPHIKESLGDSLTEVKVERGRIVDNF